MRNVHVVLVPLCFALASGFIVPSGIREVVLDLNDSKDITHSSIIKKRNVLGKTEKLVGTSAISSSTENSINRSLDIDLYEHTQTKESDVKARAYIHIKHNGKKPIRNRLYDSPVKIPQPSQKSSVFNINQAFEELPRPSSIGYTSQNLQPNTKLDNPDHRCHAMKNIKNQKKYDANSGTQDYKTFVNEQLEFIELLRAPLLRSEFKTLDYEKGENSNVINPFEFRNAKSDKLKNFGNIKGKTRERMFPLDRSEISLLDDLIEQKLNEHGSLFVCGDCLNKSKKNNLSNQLNLGTICKCGNGSLGKAKRTKIDHD